MRFRSRVLALFLLSVALLGTDASSGDARARTKAGAVTPFAVAAGGDTCATPTVISTLPFNDSGDTTNATNTQPFFLSTACAGAGMITRPGPDLVYSFTVGTGSSLTFTLDPGPNFDATLYVVGGSCSSGSGCVQESDTGIEGAIETIGPRTFDPGTYYVYVDSIYTPEECPCDHGPYTLSVTGTFGTPNNTSFYTLTPCRILDTREPAAGPALVADASRTFTITGPPCMVPPTAKSVSVNMTVTEPTSPGYLTLYPGGAARPLASTINFNVGQTRANNAILPVGASGTITVYDGQAAGTIHFILDVNGYFQ